MSREHLDNQESGSQSACESLAVTRLRSEFSELRRRIEENEREITTLRAAAQAQREILDIDGAAAFLDVHRRTVERLVKANKIPHARLHGQRGVRFVRADLVTWLRRGCPRQGKPRLNSHRRTSRPARGHVGSDSKGIENAAEGDAAPAEGR